MVTLTAAFVMMSPTQSERSYSDTYQIWKNLFKLALNEQLKSFFRFSVWPNNSHRPCQWGSGGAQ